MEFVIGFLVGAVVAFGLQALVNFLYQEKPKTNSQVAETDDDDFLGGFI